MPWDRDRYPENWEAISRAVKQRAGWRCQWCGVAHNAIGWRDGAGVFTPATVAPHGFKLIRIVLTTAHLGAPHEDGRPGDKHDKHDVRDYNLAALCQRCHLLYDLADHIANARRTRERQAREQAEAAGQLTMEL